MRLWHKDLIEVLPREQLVAQWRELSAIAGNIKTKGTPNHVLVNWVMDSSLNEFVSYAFYVREEMKSRGYKTMDSVWNKITSVVDSNYEILPFSKVYPTKMDVVYLHICYHNLLEKWMCGGITDEEWASINVTCQSYS